MVEKIDAQKRRADMMKDVIVLKSGMHLDSPQVTPEVKVAAKVAAKPVAVKKAPVKKKK